MKKALFFLLTVLLFTGCDSDDNSLPDETQEGKGTFGFRVNGNVFKGRSFTTNPFAQYPGEKRFGLYRDGYVDSLGSDFSLIVRINHPIEEGVTYLLSSTDSLFKGDYGSISYANRKENKPERQWYTTKMDTGELTITKLDTEKQIVSGRFWFDVWTDEFGVVKIRDGRFDTRYENND